MAKNKQQPGRVKSALLNWLGVPISLTTGEFWREWFGTSSSGKVVSADKVIRLSAVWACVRLLSESVSTLPLKIYERQADGSRKLAQNNPAYQILCRRPNPEMTPSRFMLMIVASVCLRGNAFVEKLYIGSKLVSLVPLLPQNMVVKRLDSGKLQYTYTDNGVQRIIPVDKMMHIRGFGLDGVCGMMPRERLRKALQNFIGSKNAGKLMVLENELTYQNVTMNPEAAQLLESRSFSIEEICRWFRLPPFMVGHTTKQSSWASSLEGMNMLFLTHTLRPLLVNIEQEISRCLLNSDEDLFAEFSVEGLLRADSAGRAAYYTSALQNGWMSRNDVRRLENMPPIEVGDIYTVQLNLTQLKNLENSNPAVQALAVRELHNHVFPDIPFEQSPLKQAA